MRKCCCFDPCLLKDSASPCADLLGLQCLWSFNRSDPFCSSPVKHRSKNGHWASQSGIRMFSICLEQILSLYMCCWEDVFHRELQACSQLELYWTVPDSWAPNTRKKMLSACMLGEELNAKFMSKSEMGAISLEPLPLLFSTDMWNDRRGITMKLKSKKSW